MYWGRRYWAYRYWPNYWGLSGVTPPTGRKFIVVGKMLIRAEVTVIEV